MITAGATTRDRRPALGPNISRFEAVRIAQRYGLTHPRAVDLRRGAWEIHGPTRHGRLDILIDARTGRVLRLHRDRGRGHRGRDRWGI